jgi:hypothetical protein
MGSAGGSLGFITNFYAAKAMTGDPYTFWEMTLFAIVTSLVGPRLRHPAARAARHPREAPLARLQSTAGIIRALAEGATAASPWILLGTVIAPWPTSSSTTTAASAGLPRRFPSSSRSSASPPTAPPSRCPPSPSAAPT